MNKAYLLIGGNEGNRNYHLQQAMANIEKFCGRPLKQSSVYETAPWGMKEQPPFLNQAVLIATSLDAPSLMDCLLEIEEGMGRKRTMKNGPRIIDIDILLFNDETIDSPRLHIPHPQMEKRRFALEPLHEIAPEFIHPVLHKTIRQLLEECTDTLDVKKI